VLTFGVAFAALNTGNNLLYLMLSLMLAFLPLSGVFSEAALRGVRIPRRLPEELFAERAGRVALEVVNAQHRVPAFAIAIEDRVREAGGPSCERPAGRVFLLRVGPREAKHGSYRFVATRRGEVTFSGFRISTRFPFGLFQKSLTLEKASRGLVYPALGPASLPPARSGTPEAGESVAARSGAGSEVGGMREYVDGDSARRIQWRASLRRGALVVRDIERRHQAELEVRLRTRGCSPGPAFERAVSRAASQVAARLDAGCRVALCTDTLRLPAAAGPRQRAQLLSFLARVEPDPAEGGSSP
jgi:uncharacterized protein (DUF58 family)